MEAVQATGLRDRIGRLGIAHVATDGQVRLSPGALPDSIGQA